MEAVGFGISDTVNPANNTTGVATTKPKRVRVKRERQFLEVLGDLTASVRGDRARTNLVNELREAYERMGY